MTNNQEITHKTDKSSLSDKHKAVLRLIADGMARGQAYKRIYPNCKSHNTATTAVAKILTKPEARAYLVELQQTRDNYINSKHQLNNDGIAYKYFQIFEKLEQAQLQSTEVKDKLNAIKLEINAIKDYALVLGKGTFDPKIKLKFMLQTAELQKTIACRTAIDDNREIKSIEQAKSLLDKTIEEISAEGL